ncbi:MAG: hypothetical protein E6I90_05355 [Chloroflexi bacterium]|nr:MAG: hypothetical protein E6I90_05355 [Chloroflexota bacterium]
MLHRGSSERGYDRLSRHFVQRVDLALNFGLGPASNQGDHKGQYRLTMCNEDKGGGIRGGRRGAIHCALWDESAPQVGAIHCALWDESAPQVGAIHCALWDESAPQVGAIHCAPTAIS